MEQEKDWQKILAKNRNQGMNGVSAVEPDYSEFVEVDPTGRYGRVCKFFCSVVAFFLRFSLPVLVFYVPSYKHESFFFFFSSLNEFNGSYYEVFDFFFFLAVQ